jgi:hypothetical protein
LTSVGTRQSSIWIHDEHGDREVSKEGYAFVPKGPNSSTTQPLPGGRALFYLVRQGDVRAAGVGERSGELWLTDLDTGRSRPVVRGRQVIGYDVSRDGTRVAFAALDERGFPHIWLVSVDRPDLPRRLAALEADSPRFDAVGDVFCRGVDGGVSYIYRLREGGSPEKVMDRPVLFFQAVSPDGSWLVAKVQPAPGGDANHTTLALPRAGGSEVVLCDRCEFDWTADGQSFVARIDVDDVSQRDRTLVVALDPGTMMPRLSGNRIMSRADLAGLPIRQEVQGWVYPDSGGAR